MSEKARDKKPALVSADEAFLSVSAILAPADQIGSTDTGDGWRLSQQQDPQLDLPSASICGLEVVVPVAHFCFISRID